MASEPPGRRPWQGSTRASRLPANWRTEIRPRILDRDRHRCQIVMSRCTIVATEVDHIIPGDDHRDVNLQAACANCNEDKNLAERPRPASTLRPRERHPGILP